MQASSIRASSERALELALGGAADEASIDARVAAFEAGERGGAVFGEKYPTLLRMCCGATTAVRQQSVRHFLPLMLAQMAAVRRSPGSEAVMQRASEVVGRAVGEQYLPKQDEHGGLLPRAAAASDGGGGGVGQGEKRVRGVESAALDGDRKRVA